MNVFCYFVEPASYTIDLARNVYDQYKIDYCFMKSDTLVKSRRTTNKEFLDQKSVVERIKFIYNIYKNHDVIIVNGYNNYIFILNFLFNLILNKRRYIATDSDSQYQIPYNFIKRFIKWIYLSCIFSNKYILGFAGGSFSHKKLFREYGMDEERIFFIPMMVDNSNFFIKNKRFPNTFTFLYVGRLVKHKGVEELILNFISNFSDKSAVLRIVGAGPIGEELRVKYQSDKIVFAGKKFDDDLVAEFHSASCFVLPSLFEPWGLVVNEALSASLPVILQNNVGANFDLIKDRNTGFVVSNINEFGEKMLKLYSDRMLLKDYSEKAGKLMRNYWNYDLYRQSILDVFDNIKKWKTTI